MVWVDDRTPEKQLTDAWTEVRLKRDKQLAASDWVTLRAVDRNEATPLGWAAYRQALRDVTTQADPFSVAWPSPPAP